MQTTFLPLLKKSLSPVLLSWVWMGCSGLAWAQPTPETTSQATEEWRFQLTPYVWMTGLGGDIQPFQAAPTAHIHRSFSDLLKELDAALFLSGTARKGAYVLQTDLSHAATSDTAQLPLGLTANTKIRQTSWTLTGGYNWQSSPNSSIDVMAGGRMWRIHASVYSPGLGLAAASSTTFTDPIVALRWRYELAPRWSTLLYADAGGFGIGSKSTWQAMGAINYQIKDDLHLSFGYRQLNVDYRKQDKRLDFRLGGPLVGATWRF